MAMRKRYPYITGMADGVSEREERMAAKKRRREKPEIRAVKILDAAERCFRTLGFQASTVDRIAAEAEVSVGLLYRYFDSKAAIIKEIIARDSRAQLDEISAAIDAAPDDLGSFVQNMIARVADSGVDRDRIALMFEIASETCRNPELQAFLREQRAEVGRTLMKQLAGRGCTRKQAKDILEQLDALSALASGAAVHALLYSDASPADSYRLILNLMSFRK